MMMMLLLRTTYTTLHIDGRLLLLPVLQHHLIYRPSKSLFFLLLLESPHHSLPSPNLKFLHDSWWDSGPIFYFRQQIRVVPGMGNSSSERCSSSHISLRSTCNSHRSLLVSSVLTIRKVLSRNRRLPTLNWSSLLPYMPLARHILIQSM